MSGTRVDCPTRAKIELEWVTGRTVLDPTYDAEKVCYKHLKSGLSAAEICYHDVSGGGHAPIS